jgi:hypothetical protein
MDPVLAFFTLLCIFGVLMGVVLLPFRKRRLLGKWLSISGVVGVVASFVIFVLRADDVAKGAGFLNATDRQVAEKHGYGDAREWAHVRERFAHQEAKAAAEAARKREEVAVAKAKAEVAKAKDEAEAAEAAKAALAARHEAEAQAAIAARDKFIAAAIRIDFPTLVSETGCDSTYSEQKKADKFAPFKNKAVIVTGEIAKVDDDGDIDLKMLSKTFTYDLRVTPKNRQDSYDLEKGEIVTVAFIMRRAGGCFLPYKGR